MRQGASRATVLHEVPDVRLDSLRAGEVVTDQNRTAERWRLFKCSDCDEDNNVVVAVVPDRAPWDYGCPFDYCPACGSYLSMLGVGNVEVSSPMMPLSP